MRTIQPPRSTPLPVVLALLALLPAPLQAQMNDAATIRAIRAASNAAIAERDLPALRRTVTDDVNVTASSGSVFVGGDARMPRFQPALDAPEHATCVRTPDEVSVSEVEAFAAERGHWVGRWRKPDGEMRVTGTYMAQWQRRNGEWRIRSELFVALACEGSEACRDRSTP